MMLWKGYAAQPMATKILDCLRWAYSQSLIAKHCLQHWSILGYCSGASEKQRCVHGQRCCQRSKLWVTSTFKQCIHVRALWR